MTRKIKWSLFHQIYYVERETDNAEYISVLVPHASHVLLVARTCHDWSVVVVMAGGILLSFQKFTPSVLLLKIIN